MTTEPNFTITTAGTSQTRILLCDGDPIARFYAGRVSESLLRLIERKLNERAAT